MIYVSMRQYDRIDLARSEPEEFGSSGGFTSLSLKHPAIEQDRVSVDVQDMAGARDLSSRTIEGDLQMRSNLRLLRYAGTRMISRCSSCDIRAGSHPPLLRSLRRSVRVSSSSRVCLVSLTTTAWYSFMQAGMKSKLGERVLRIFDADFSTIPKME